MDVKHIQEMHFQTQTSLPLDQLAAGVCNGEMWNRMLGFGTTAFPWITAACLEKGN